MKWAYALMAAAVLALLALPGCAMALAAFAARGS